MLTFSILSLAALALASPVPSAQDYSASLKHVARQSVTQTNVNNFAFYAEHASAAYCNDKTPVGGRIYCGGSSGNCYTVETNGVTVLGAFDGFLSGISAYVSLDTRRGEIVLSVRGSSNVRNWISNLDFNFENSPLVSGGRVHDGFNRAWNELRSGVTTAIRNARAARPTYRVVATGHSLGGAVATLGAAQLRKDGIPVDLYTYGSPRVGNGVLVDYISAQAGAEFRVTHRDDPVPRLPPIIFGFRHTSPEYWLAGPSSTGNTYPLGDIRVCTGNANIFCNGGTFGLNIFAHLSYFGDMSSLSCPAKWGLKGRDDAELDLAEREVAEREVTERTLTDAELEAKLNAWVRQDIAFVQG